MTKTITTVVQEGHKIASGTASNSPYPDGSISMQAEFFKKAGVDLDNYYMATLNLSIAPKSFKILTPEFTIRDVQWANGFDAEDFSFSRCLIRFNEHEYTGLIYYPHPETKIDHFHSASLIEVITSFIPDIKYGDHLILKYNDNEINIY